MKTKFTFFILSSFFCLSNLIIQAQITTDSLKAFYPFNGNANDETYNGHDGTINGPTLTTDRFNNINSAYDFDGNNDYIELDNEIGKFGTSDFSISLWYYPLTSGKYIIVKRNTEGWANFWEWTDFRFTINQNSTNTSSTVDGSSAELNEWHHAVIVKSSSKFYLYLDNQLVDSTLLSQTYDVTNNNPCEIGAQVAPVSGVVGDFTGKIDDIRFYTKQLDTTEIEALFYENYPQISLDPVSQTICNSETLILFVEKFGELASSFQWQKEGVDIVGETNDTLIISNIGSYDSGNYRCIITDYFGTDTSAVAIINVDIPPAVTIFGNPEADEYETLTYSVTQVPGSIYEWFIESGAISVDNGNSIDVIWGPTAWGYVKMLETNSNGCVSDTNILQVAIGNISVSEINDDCVLIFPNPATENIYINIKDYKKNKIENIIIENIKGQKVFAKKIMSDNTVIKTNENNISGIAFVKIYNNKGEIIKSEKLIIK